MEVLDEDGSESGERMGVCEDFGYIVPLGTDACDAWTEGR